MSSPLAIVIKDISRSYGEIKALNNISLNIPTGKIFGLLGPNGSGKTTLIRSIIGSLKPDSGLLTVLNKDPILERFTLRKHIGYMPQLAATYDELSARDNIRFFGELQGVDDLENKVQSILEFTELAHRAEYPVRTFSGGMKKRVSLACAMIHEPKLLILDEPTAAVDPHLKIQSWELFRKLADQGVTIVVSTHLMDEALRCDQLCILNRGELIAMDTPKGILEKGRTTIAMTQNGKQVQKEISSEPTALAETLKHYGLSSEIQSIDLYPDSIEDIVLRMVDNIKKPD